MKEIRKTKWMKENHILKLNDVFGFVCLSELIEKLVRATELRFGMRVEYNLSRNEF